MDIVSVVIPTLDRPECLKRALASVLSQQGLEDVALEIIVVDNSRQGSARAPVATLEGPIRLVHEPRPGVANARNAGVDGASGRWIAFLDDDEEASPHWLASLITVARRSGADAVFGPIEGRAEGGRAIGEFSAYFSRQLERPDGADITSLYAYLGTNNSMFDRARCLRESFPFDVDLNESGGEDSLLILRLKQRGRRFAWAAEASVVEWAPPRRLNWAYVCKRKFASGQIRVFVRHMSSSRRWDVIVGWMTIGVAQFVVAGLAALALRAIDPNRSRRAQAAAFGGLGKVLWLRSFRPTLYGAGLVS